VKQIRVFLTASQIEALDRLVEAGRFGSRSEAIRLAIHDLLRREKR